MACIQYNSMSLLHAMLTPCAAYGCPNSSSGLCPILPTGDQKIDFEEFKCLAALLPKRDHAIYRGALSCDPIVVPKARPGEEAKMTPVQRDRLEAQEKTKQALNEALARLRVKMRLNDDKMLLKVCGLAADSSRPHWPAVLVLSDTSCRDAYTMPVRCLPVQMVRTDHSPETGYCYLAWRSVLVRTRCYCESSTSSTTRAMRVWTRRSWKPTCAARLRNSQRRTRGSS